MNSMKRQKDRTLKVELPRSVGTQYATRDQWRDNSRKNEGMEPKQKQYPLWMHSRMSGSRSVSIPLWLSGSWRSFLYSSSVYSRHLLISSASVRPLPFLSFTEPIFAWNIPLVSLIFLKRSLAFHIWLSLISLHWSLRKAFLSLLAIHLPSNGYIFAFLLFSFALIWT